MKVGHQNQEIYDREHEGEEQVRKDIKRAQAYSVAILKKKAESKKGNRSTPYLNAGKTHANSANLA